MTTPHPTRRPEDPETRHRCDRRKTTLRAARFIQRLDHEPASDHDHERSRLDANIELTAAEPGSTRLTLNGCYDPPFGFVGEMIDRALLSVAAQQTAETLVVDIADKLQAMTG
jgi:hypothetical protein